MDEKSIRQMILIKYYLSAASSQYQIDQEPARFVAINLLHEALEAALISCAEHVNASINDKTTIDQYFNKIDEKLIQNHLPFRSKMLQFNRARVSAKHALTLADASHLRNFFEVVPEFIRESIKIVFNVELDDVNLISLVAGDEERQFLEEAATALNEGQFYEGLINIRKAFYITFEKNYDISCFAGTTDGEKYDFLDPRMSCDAPSYAKSSGYIERNVSDPFSYIVLDHARIDALCLKNGLTPSDVWNIWRLTPALWRNKDGKWLAKYCIDIAENPNISEDLRYSLDTMTSILLKIQSKKNSERYKNSVFKSIGVKSEVQLYKKASAGSSVVGTIPSGVKRLNVLDAVPALDGDEWYWIAMYARKGGPFLFGYLLDSDTDGQLDDGVNPFEDAGS